MIPSAADGAEQGVSIRHRRLGTHVIGGLLGGLVGGAFVEFVITALKEMLDFFSGQATWLLILLPLTGLALTTLVLHGIDRLDVKRHAHGWRAFPPGAVRSDITGDIVANAGQEERFPWRLAALRLVAILATVGSGGALGSEAPAAYLGVASGACLCDRGRWRRLLRPAALGGGAAGVSVLMGIPLVGTAYVLELGKQNNAPYSLERVTAALVGGGVGWALNMLWDVNLIRLVVPKEPPANLTQAVITALCIGLLAGLITSLAASAIQGAKKWKAPPLVRLAIGGLAAAGTAVTLATVAGPGAAFGPGGGSILWAETHTALPLTLLAVALLRAASTTAATAAGGCGGIFVPFLAIGDIAGRVFAPGLELGGDLAGAAGAAGGIAGGYRLPLTAIAMVLGVGGPHTATLTCLAVVVVAYNANRLNPFTWRSKGVLQSDAR